MPSIFFLIRSLGRGGAERQLIELARELQSRGYKITICTLYDGGELRPHAASIPGIEVVSLGKTGRWDVLRFAQRLSRVIRRVQPDILHGYMPVANELSLIAARLSGVPCIFGIRASNMDFSQYDAIARLVFRFGGVCSRFADSIIANSAAGAQFHAQNGYASGRMVVIPNGIDTERFKPNKAARELLRSRWSVLPHERLVGLVARLDPMKDHQTFLDAAKLVAQKQPHARFVCVGAGPLDYALALQARSATLGLNVIWTGGLDDVGPVYNALDVAVLSSSFGEGFPNVIGEAMASGTPCAVTQVGDAALVVRSTGYASPPRDAAALANGIVTLLKLPDRERMELGERARRRIVEDFSVFKLAESTEQVLQACLTGATSRTGRV